MSLVLLENVNLFDGVLPDNVEISGMERELGGAKPGGLVDLLSVDGNPLQDIGLLAESGVHLSVIMKDGRFVKHLG